MSRHNLTDEEWNAIRPLLPKERTGEPGRPWRPHREVINGIFFLIRTGIPWRDLPAEFGPWQTVYKRFRRWRRDGIWERLVAKVLKRFLSHGEIDFELWCIDGTVVRAHRAAAGARKQGKLAEENAEKNGLGRSRGGFSTKLHILTDGQGIPLGVTVTPGQRNEGPEFPNVIDSSAISIFRLCNRPEALAGDKAYATNAIRDALRTKGINDIIPSRSHEKENPNFDRELYRARNIVERFIGWLKEYRRIATRYEKLVQNYLAVIHIAMFRMLLNWN